MIKILGPAEQGKRTFAEQSASTMARALKFAVRAIKRVVTPIARIYAELDFASGTVGPYDAISAMSATWACIRRHYLTGELWAVTSGATGYVARSLDGVHWERVRNAPAAYYGGITIIPGGAHAGRIVVSIQVAAGGVAPIWYSDDDGATWTSSTFAGGAYTANPTGVAANSAGTLIACGRSGFGNWKSTDGGATWTPVTLHLAGDAWAVESAGTEFYIMAGRVFRTTNDGATWNPIDSWGGTSKGGARGLSKYGSTYYLATNDAGVISTTDGITYTTVTGFPGTNYYGICADVNGIVAGDFTAQSAKVSTDSGASSYSTEEGASVTVGSGACSFAEIGARRYRKIPRMLRAPFASVQGRVTFSQTPAYVGSGSDATWDVAICGFRRDPLNYVALEVNNLTGSWYIRGAVAGTGFVSTVAWQATTQTMEIALSWDGTVLTGWGLIGDQWIPVTQYVMSDSAGLSAHFWKVGGWYPAFGSYCSVSGSVLKWLRFRFGSPGRCGMRDLAVVTYETGEPVKDATGRTLFSATCSPPLTATNATHSTKSSHCGVFALDHRTMEISEELGTIYSVDTSTGNRAVVGYTPAKVVINRVDRSVDIYASDWALAYPGSAAGKSLRLMRSKCTRLEGDLYVSSDTVLIGGGANYNYDADVIYHGGLWRMVTTGGSSIGARQEIREAPTVAGLATATPTIIALAGEGPKYSKVGGIWSINVQGALFDLAGVAGGYLSLDIAGRTNMGTPHLSLIPAEDGDGTRYDALYPDGAQWASGGSNTGGGVVVASSQTVSGTETY